MSRFIGANHDHRYKRYNQNKRISPAKTDLGHGHRGLRQCLTPPTLASTPTRVTSAKFNPLAPDEVLASFSSENVYLFDLKREKGESWSGFVDEQKNNKHCSQIGDLYSENPSFF